MWYHCENCNCFSNDDLCPDCKKKVFATKQEECKPSENVGNDTIETKAVGLLKTINLLCAVDTSVRLPKDLVNNIEVFLNEVDSHKTIGTTE